MSQVGTALPCVYTGATLIRKAATKQERLARALTTVQPGNVYHAEAYAPSNEPETLPGPDTWSYVGSKGYNDLLESALKRTFIRKPVRHAPPTITPKTEQFVRVLDMVGDLFGDDGFRNKTARHYNKRREATKHELLKILDQKSVATKRSRFCKYVPENHSHVTLEVSTEKQDIPLMRWELDIANNDGEENVKNIDGSKMENDCKLCDMIDKQEEAYVHRHVRERGVIDGQVEGELTLSEQGRMRQAWMWIDSIERSEPSEYMNQGSGVVGGEVVIDLRREHLSPSAKHIALRGSTTTSLSTEEAFAVPSDDDVGMMDTIAVSPQIKPIVDDLTLETEVSPSQMPVLSTNEVKQEQKTSQEKRRKHSKKKGKKSTLTPLDLDKISGFYVVNAGVDWAFD